MPALQNVAPYSDKRITKPWNSTKLPRKRGGHFQVGFPIIAFVHPNPAPDLSLRGSTPKKIKVPHPPVEPSTKDVLFHKLTFFQLHTIRPCVEINTPQFFTCFGAYVVYLQDDPDRSQHFLPPPAPAPAPGIYTRTNQAPWF